MHNYLEFFNLPEGKLLILMMIFGLMQGIGEFLEFKGQVVPEIMKVRKFFKRRKDEKEAYREVPKLLTETKTLLEDVRQHYNVDNITKRDKWMEWVNSKAQVYDDSISEIKDVMSKNNKITLDLLIDSKRNYLLDFTSKAADITYPLSKEQYQRFFNIHKEYEDIIEENGLVNGQVDVAYDVVTKSFEERLAKHAFIEDSHEFGI